MSSAGETTFAAGTTGTAASLEVQARVSQEQHEAAIFIIERRLERSIERLISATFV